MQHPATTVMQSPDSAEKLSSCDHLQNVQQGHAIDTYFEISEYNWVTLREDA